MPPKNSASDTFDNRLSQSRELSIGVTGRKSGRAISITIWFVFEDENLYLLPVHGSDTQWYKNVLSNPAIKISAGGSEAEFRAVALTDAKQVSSVIEKFRARYGASEIKKYYAKFDVAVLARKFSKQ